MAKRCPNKLTPQIAEDIYELAAKGYTLRLIAKTVGVSYASLKVWNADGKLDDSHPALQEFSYRLDLARHKSKSEMLEKLVDHGDKDWRAIAWVLERTTDEFKMKSRMSQAAQDRLDDLAIQKAEAELDYVKAKTASLKDGVVSEEDVVAELDRIQRETAIN